LAFELRWKRPLGSGYSGISIAEDTLVTAVDEAERIYVAALDPATGEERWRYDLASRHAGHDGSHDGPISTPAIADGRVFAMSPGGQLAAIDLQTGEALWTLNLVDDLGSERPFYDFGGSPLVVGDTMVLHIGGEAGAVAGFDVGTGEIRWRAFQDEVWTQSPILAELGGRAQVLVLGLEKVAALDPSDGLLLWELARGDGPRFMGFSSPVPLDSERILLQGGRETASVVRLTTEGDQLVPTLSATSRGMTKSYSPPSPAGDLVFGYTGRFLSAIDPTTGELMWRSREPGDGFLLTIDDQLVVLTKKGSLHLGAVSPQGWQESVRLDLFEDLAWTPPSYAGGAIYVRSLGEMARVDLVRTAEPVAEVAEEELPGTLQALAKQIAEAADPAPVVDRFLAGSELPLVDGNEVVFLWRGEAQDLAIAGDMIGMRREEPMKKLPGTDLWWWATEMDSRAPASYLFYVDYEPTTDPSHDRTTRSTILGADMNWSREGVEMSWFAMPGWPGWEIARTVTRGRDQPDGELSFLELTIQPAASEGGELPEPLSVSLPVWIPPGYEDTETRYPVLYMVNEAAREVGEWPRSLTSVAGRTAQPVIVVFLELPDLGFEQEIDRIADQVVPAVDEHYRTIPDRDRRGIVGMGWGGWFAAMTVFKHPEVFGTLGVQSFFTLDEHRAMLEAAIGDHDASTLPLMIYLEWGRWDLNSPFEGMDFRASSKQAWDMFTKRGWQPMGGEVWDSTDWASWRHRTGVMLEALFPIDGAATSLPAWLTPAQ
jgi:outer membrane protein assembly factor BamB